MDHPAGLPAAIEGEIVTLVEQEDLVRERHIAARLVAAAEKGGADGGKAGVEAAMAPALAAAYSIPFLIHFLWGFFVTLLSLLGAALYGLRRLWHWLCTAR
jgi:hypothetical protein